MDSQRSPLVIALLFVSFTIWQVWEQDKNPQPQAQQTMQTTTTAAGSAADQGVPTSGQGRLILIKTDVLGLTINARGGDVEQVLLPVYPKELNFTQPFQLLETSPQFIYQAQSGLTGHDGPDNPVNGPRLLYNVEKDAYVLAEGQNELQAPMTYTDVAGNTSTKVFVLKCGDYAVNVNYNVQNAGKKPLEIPTLGQLKQSTTLPPHLGTGSSNFALHTFRGATYSMPDERYEKYKLDVIVDNENLNIPSKGGWVVMLQQYFATAWIPYNDGINNFYTANLGNSIVAIGHKSQLALAQFGQTGAMNSTLWVGPEIQDKMAAVAPHLDLTVDYGWSWFISQPLFKLLRRIRSFVGNWGFFIIIITFIVRGIMYPLTKAQYISIAKMRILRPRTQAVRERPGDDKQRISQEMMVLYKVEKANPLGGCFPLLIQMSIFLALHYMLMGSVELRQTPFALRIHDPFAQGPYYTPPVLMDVTVFFVQKMSPTTVADPMQQKTMTFMPAILIVLFLWFPSGLVLYYIASNLITTTQQQLTYRGPEKRGLHSREKKKP